MYLSLLQIKNFRCFDGNEHSITFKKGLNVLVGENDSGKSAIMDAIKLVLGTTDMNWYRVEQEDFYKEDATLEIKMCRESTDGRLWTGTWSTGKYKEKSEGDVKPSFYSKQV